MSNQITPQVINLGSILAGKYRIDEVLGRGGMGIVYKARHLELHDDFAIKLMQGREFANPRSVERFLREARAAARLRSKTEHIVQVHDIGRIDSGEPFIVMEILVGQDLANLLTIHRVLPIAEACAYIMQACQALDAAHELGIIHRDLKPANLFLTRRRDGSPSIKVLDFGISKQVMTEEDSTEAEITGTQDVMGSPLYMAPELAKAARNASPRSDIWALGAILYKLLTGKTPFPAPSPAELFAALLGPESAPRPSALRPDIPPQLEAAILRCLEKNATARYTSVRELMTDLVPFGNASAANFAQKRETGAYRTQGESTADDWDVRSHHGDAPAKAPSRHIRRPSLVEPLPEGFELRPPPAPPRPPMQSSATPLPQVTTYSNLPSIVSTATLTAFPRSAAMATTSSGMMDDTRQTGVVPEATGSTWGTTQSKLSDPRKIRIRLLGGLAGIIFLVLTVFVMVTVKSLGRAASPPSDTVPSATPETTPSNSQKPPIVKPIDTQRVDPSPVVPSASAAAMPILQMPMIPGSVVAPKPTASSGNGVSKRNQPRVTGPPVKKKSNFDQF